MGDKKYIVKLAPIQKEAISDPWHALAAEIIIGAVDDWRLLIEKRAWDKGGVCLHGIGYSTFDALRGFFRGDWCAFLAQYFDIEPACILEHLEKELQQAIENDDEEQRREEAARRKKRKRCNK